MKRKARLKNAIVRTRVDGRNGADDKTYLSECTVILHDLPFACRKALLRFRGKHAGDADIDIDLTIDDMESIVRAWKYLKTRMHASS